MTKFVEGTKVPVNQTRIKIERTLQRFGATAFAYFTSVDKASVLANTEYIRYLPNGWGTGV
jgi:hypothetical protein